VRPRESLGSADSRRLRKQGIIPGVLYGRSEPQAIQVAERDLRQALTGAGGLHAILDVVVEGAEKTHPSVLKDYQQHPVRGGVTHVDLHEVRLDQPIQATVTVTLIGEAAGSREGGVLSQVVRELTVEALPMEIPEHIDFDVSGMNVGDTARVADLSVPEGATVLDDPDTVIANVTLPMRTEDLDAAAAEAAEGGPAAAAAEGEDGDGEPGADDPDADAAGEHQTVEG
jgi:large subunit ribosomal protein L25